MSNFGDQQNNPGPNPDFYSFRFSARPANTAVPYESAGYTPSSRYAAGTFQTIYGSFNSRMRRISDFEPVKHKRSRKGCFTCRARRVKCDEVRPRCQRCRKGKRACVFPDEPGSPSTEDVAKSTTEEQQPSSGQSSSHTDATTEASLEGSVERGRRSGSAASSHDLPSPSDHGSSSSVMQDREASTQRMVSSADLNAYLEYFSSHVSHHHYGFIEEENGSYLRTQLAQHALKDEALMYAIVAFTAYLIMVSQDESSMEGFLDYYSSSMYMLRTSLQGGAVQRLSVTTLMTVLQLALLEEYLGDWVNLQAHKRAALSLITEMYTPESMVGDPLAIILLEWYMRFDQFTAFMSKSQNSLEREWFQANGDARILQLQGDSLDPKAIRIKGEMSLRLLGKDISTFFGTIDRQNPSRNSPKDAEISSLAQRVERWHEEFGNQLLNNTGIPASLKGKAPAVPQVSLPHGGASDSGANSIWPSKHLVVRFWTLELFFNQAASLLQLRRPESDLANQVRSLCNMLEDIESNDPHPDAILGISACLGMAGIAAKSDPVWAPWCHEKFLAIASKGYLFPSAIRKFIASSEASPDVDSPLGFSTDSEPAIITAVREWVDERSNNQLDNESGSIRDMAGIIGSIDMQAK